MQTNEILNENRLNEELLKAKKHFVEKAKLQFDNGNKEFTKLKIKLKEITSELSNLAISSNLKDENIISVCCGYNHSFILTSNRN